MIAPAILPYNHSFLFFISIRHSLLFFFFFFNDTATTEIYTLSLHDALPISPTQGTLLPLLFDVKYLDFETFCGGVRSEEHTSELQSQSNLVCRLLLEKKKKLCNYVVKHIIQYILMYR